MKIQLREYQRTDIPRLVQLINNAKIAKYMTKIPHPYTLQDAEWWLDVGVKSEEETTRVISILNADGEYEFVGAIGAIKGSGPKSHTAEIGYWLGEPYWGQGIVSKAVKEFSTVYMKEFGVTKMYAGVFEPNKGSMKVLEKCGWKLEGILKKELFKDGNYYDEHRYALWKEEEQEA